MDSVCPEVVAAARVLVEENADTVAEVVPGKAVAAVVEMVVAHQDKEPKHQGRKERWPDAAAVAGQRAGQEESQMDQTKRAMWVAEEHPIDCSAEDAERWHKDSLTAGRALSFVAAERAG